VPAIWPACARTTRAAAGRARRRRSPDERGGREGSASAARTEGPGERHPSLASRGGVWLGRSACKPGSVGRAPKRRPDGHFSRDAVARVLQQPTRGSMLRARALTPLSRRAVSRRLFGLAPAGVYRAAPVAGSAVGSYPTVSPLPAVSRRRSLLCGTVRRAAVASGTPRGYLAACPVEPGLSSIGATVSRSPRRDRPADRPRGNIMGLMPLRAAPPPRSRLAVPSRAPGFHRVITRPA
jgi:hypothetical protein